MSSTQVKNITDSFSRRSFLSASGALLATAALAACSEQALPVGFITSADPQVGAYEAQLVSTGRRVSQTFMPMAQTVDLGGVTAKTWAFGNEPVGPEVRLSAGDRLVATVNNMLPAQTSIHWHGVALRNDMDGVPRLTQPAIAAGSKFTYDAVIPDPGTYWYHSHVGTQLDRGLSGPLIVEDPHEPLKYDDEWVIVLKDWVDGITGTPDDVLKELSRGMGGTSTSAPMPSMSGMESSTTPSPSMGGTAGSGGMKYMLTGATSALLGGDAGDVKYPFYLINGRTARDPKVFTGKPGARVRLRIINTGGDTAFRFAVGGHKLTVTHTDGYPIMATEADALLLGNGERYDALITLKDGVFPIMALAEGKKQRAMAIIRTGAGTVPALDAAMPEFTGRIPMAWDLKPTDAGRLPAKKVDRVIRMNLTGSMGKYDWGIDGRRFNAMSVSSNRFGIKKNERVRLEWKNTTAMWHPMHLHGHTFELDGSGTRKDTVIVLPHTTMKINFDAVNPGVWAYHCHNSYHLSSGMMGSVSYEV